MLIRYALITRRTRLREMTPGDQQMSALAVLPRLAEQNGVFLCSDLSQRESPRRYRVPVEHRRFELFGEAFDEAIRSVTSAGGGDTARQIASALADSGGIGLFAAKGWPL